MIITFTSILCSTVVGFFNGASICVDLHKASGLSWTSKRLSYSTSLDLGPYSPLRTHLSDTFLFCSGY